MDFRDTEICAECGCLYIPKLKHICYKENHYIPRLNLPLELKREISAKVTVDLIIKLEDKIKELTEENANWEAIAEGYRKQFEDCAEERAKLTEENERLKTELRKTAQKLKAVEEVNEKLTADNEWLKRPRYNVHPDGKIEMIPTIKQFADRLKRYYDENEKYLGYSIAYNIDRVAEELIKGAGATDNKCVACGETIPEGRQVCPGCE